MLRTLHAYVGATALLSLVDVLVLVQRFGDRSGLSAAELPLLPLLGIAEYWPLHLLLLACCLAWVACVQRLPEARALLRTCAYALPVACAFGAALHFSIRLPLVARAPAADVLRHLVPPLGLLAVFPLALLLRRLGRGAGPARRLLVAAPVLLALALFGAAACMTFAVMVRIPATVFVLSALTALGRYVMGERAPTRREGLVTASVAGVVMLAAVALPALLPETMVRLGATVAYRTYMMQALLFTKLFAFGTEPALPPCEPPPPLPSPAPRAAPDRPRNVLVFTVDALRADHMAAAGYDRTTMPRLEALRQRSLWFDNAYAPAPATEGSTVAFWSAVGVPTLRRARVWPPTLHLELRKRGYATFATRLADDIGGAVPGLRQPASFDASAAMGLDGQQLVDAILRFVDDSAARPWVATAHALEPHDRGRYARLPQVFPLRPWSRYDDALHYVDGLLGRLLDGLEQRGLRDDTVVIVSADHGEFFGEHGRLYHGSLLYEPVMRVPLLVHVPGLAPRRVAFPASGFDIAPTALRAATGAPWPTPSMGQDLLALVDTLDNTEAARAVFMENVPGVRGVRRHVAVRRGRWKYAAFLGTDVEELFDLGDDPAELRNRAGRRPRVLADMRRELQRLLSRRSCAIEALRARAAP